LQEHVATNLASTAGYALASGMDRRDNRCMSRNSWGAFARNRSWLMYSPRLFSGWLTFC